MLFEHQKSIGNNIGGRYITESKVVGSEEVVPSIWCAEERAAHLLRTSLSDLVLVTRVVEILFTGIYLFLILEEFAFLIV